MRTPSVMAVITLLVGAGALIIARSAQGATMDGLKVVRMYPFKGGYGKRAGAPKYIVCHYSMTSSAQSTRRVLAAKGLSVNYEVDQDGTVYEYLDPAKFFPYASGAGNNSLSIAIEFTAKSPPAKGEWPAPQIEAGSKLLIALCNKYNISPTVVPEGVRGWSQGDVIQAGYGIARHRNLASTSCPGTLPIESMVNFDPTHEPQC